MIEVPQLWLPDRLRERREDERLMRGRGGLSRRWMPGNPCCCGGCLLFEDDFDRANIGDEWEVVSGDWSIDTSRLVSSDANAKICIEAGSQKIGSIDVSVVITAQLAFVSGPSTWPPTYARQQIHTGSSDYVEILWSENGNWAAVAINGGTAGSWISVGKAATVKICHKPHAIVALINDAFARAAMPVGEPGIPCLGYGSPTGEMYFKSVRVEHGASVRAGCPTCAICANCPDAPPDDIEVTITGVTLNAADYYPVNDCEQPSLEDYANDTFILSMREPCKYCFGCLLPTTCRETGEDAYEDVYFLLRFQFYNAGSGKVGYWLEEHSGYQRPPGGYCSVEGNCYISSSTDTCGCGWGEYHGFREAPADNDEDNTCLPDGYQFAGAYNRCCGSLLDWSNAVVKVSAA